MDESVAVQSIVSQYGASLAMLLEVMQACPEEFWLSEEYGNRFWHVAYHALFYTHLYVSAGEADFKPWVRHRPDSQYLGDRARGGGGYLAAYSKEEVMEYYRFCCEEVAAKTPVIGLDTESGFRWLPCNRLEVHFYNIRHLQHHTGQLADRLSNALGIGTPWVRMGTRPGS